MFFSLVHMLPYVYSAALHNSFNPSFPQDRPPPWVSGQSFWLQIQRFDSWRYQIFLEVAGLERCPLSLVMYN
jgi:hypothetical protein